MWKTILAVIFAACGAAMAFADTAGSSLAAGQVVMNETFDAVPNGALPAGWRAVAGKPRVEGGRLLISGRGEANPLVYFGKQEWENYRVEVDLSLEAADNDSRWAALVWRGADRADGTNYYLYTVRQKTTAPNGIEFSRRMPKDTAPMWSVYNTASAPVAMQPNVTHHLALQVESNHVRQWFDGKLVIDSLQATALPSGRLGFTCSSAKAWFDNLKVTVLPHAEPVLPASATALVVAHRGYSAVAPENTLSAYRAAIEIAAPAAECDVYRSQDGQIVLSHDATVKRCTNGDGRISDLTLAQLQALDAGAWKSARFKGERIPTLREILALTKGKLRLVIEIKQADIVPDVAAVVREADAFSDVTVIAFDYAVCKQMRAVEPRIAVGWLIGGGSFMETAAADELVQRALSANVQFLDVVSGAVTPVLVERAGLAGMAVWCWTVNVPEQIRAMADLGIRGITTDDPVTAARTLSGK